MSRLRLLRVLHLRQVRRQPLRTTLAVLAVGAGVALSVAAGLLVSSLDESVTDVLRSLSGPAPLRVVGPLDRAGLDAHITGKVAEVDGVQSVVPAVHAVAVAETVDGRELYLLALGVDCRVEALVGAFGCDERVLGPSDREGPLLVSGALKRELGAGAMMRTDIGRIRIGDVAANDSLDGTNSGRVAVFALPTAQKLFGRSDRLDALYVRPKPGVDLEKLRGRIQAVAGDWNSVLRRGELPPWMQVNGPLLPLLGLAGVMALGLSGLLVYNIVALSLAERRRDFAVASAVGARPLAVTTGVLAEAGLLGVAGGVVGALAGIPLLHRMVATISSVLFEQALGIRVVPHISVMVLVTGVLLGALTAVIAAWVPARRARRLDVAGEIHGRTVHEEEAPRRAGLRVAIFVAGGALGVMGTSLSRRNGALEWWQSPLGTACVFVTSALAVAAVGAAAPLLLRVVLRPLQARGGPFRVAVSNLVARPRRTSVMAAAVGAAVGMACVLGSVFPAIRAVTLWESDREAAGRVWVSTLPMNNAGASARPSPDVLRSLASLPGVARVDLSPCVSIGDDQGPLGVCASEWSGRAPFDVVAGDVSRGALERGEVIVGTTAARSHNVRPGSMLRVATPTGFRQVRVAGIWATANDNGYRVTVSPRRFEELFGPERAEYLYLQPEPGVSPEELARRVEAARLDPDLYALPPEEAAAQLADEVGDQVTPFWTLQRLLLFVALIATLSTLLLIGVQRRRELGVLGAVGFGAESLARMTIAEAVGAGVAGAVLGVAVSVGMFEALRNVSAVAIGIRPPFRFDTVSAVVATGLAVVVVGIGGLLPAWRTARLQIVEAIRDE